MNKPWREKIIFISSYAFVAYLIWLFVLFLFQTSSDGDATVNVFSDPSLSKNYQLSAYVTVDGRFSSPFTDGLTYTINQINWPNGGYETFDSECTTNSIGERVKCTTMDGKTYYIEVVRYPSD